MQLKLSLLADTDVSELGCGSCKALLELHGYKAEELKKTVDVALSGLRDFAGERPGEMDQEDENQKQPMQIEQAGGKQSSEVKTEETVEQPNGIEFAKSYSSASLPSIGSQGAPFCKHLYGPFILILSNLI